MTASQTKKAKKTAKKAVKKASTRAEKAGVKAADRAADLAERTGERLHGGASDLAVRLRESEAIGRAQETAGELGERAKDAWHDSHLDERAAELAKRVRDTEVAQKAADRTKHLTESGLAALGAWLATSPAAEQLGVKKQRAWPLWTFALVGAAVGFVIGRLTAPKPGADVRGELAAAADRLTNKASDAIGDAKEDAGPVATVLADTVRSTLAADTRTAELAGLSVNVAEGTVFVRGKTPADVDEAAIRAVIAAVPGVRDVDLQLTSVS